MPNTGERREITKRVNAKEAETVQQSKKLVSRTREITADTDEKNLARTTRTNKRDPLRANGCLRPTPAEPKAAGRL